MGARSDGARSSPTRGHRWVARSKGGERCVRCGAQRVTTAEQGVRFVTPEGRWVVDPPACRGREEARP